MIKAGANETTFVLRTSLHYEHWAYEKVKPGKINQIIASENNEVTVYFDGLDTSALNFEGEEGNYFSDYEIIFCLHMNDEEEEEYD
mmetsp:Transcript_2521/g.2151  ORF Transcript_2521/g.2151 Transcript_2521/m.2151 type:complete len:86 (+) Transcript_2521:4940-5197(+)